ncbi:MAG: ATP-binding protein [Actinomycetota bacterium]
MDADLTFHRTIARSHLELSALRHDVRAWLERIGDAAHPSPIDIDVVVTELVANAIDHTSSSSVDLTLAVAAGRVRVQVANDVGDDEPVLASEWREAGERGRGLRLVAALSSDLQLGVVDDRSVVVAELLADRQTVGEA